MISSRMNHSIEATGSAQSSRDDQAARWRVRLSMSNLSAHDRSEFERWLKESPDNRLAFDAMDRAWEAAGEEADDRAMLRMRESALRFQAAEKPSSWAWPASIAATIALACGVWSWNGKLGWSGPEGLPTEGATHEVTMIKNVTRGQYETHVGERSIIELADGSTVTLDTASRVSLDLTAKEREVHLLAGQANFEVAKDKARPFVVYAADRRITAVGTAFDVRLEQRVVLVTLAEGKVAVDQLAMRTENQSHNEPLVRTNLEAGEQLVAAVGGAASIRGANLEQSNSWRNGRLVFEAERLADAIVEINRYSTTPIVIADSDIGEIKISGVFSTSTPKSFTHALTEYFAIDAVEQGDVTVLRWRH
jgi:transmembrane sensor